MTTRRWRSTPPATVATRFANGLAQGLHDHDGIERQRPSLDVVSRQRNLVWQDALDILALRVGRGGQQRLFVLILQRIGPGHPGPQTEQRLEVSAKQIDILRHLGTRADQRHVAADDVEQLRKLVHLGSTQETTRSRDPFISQRRDGGTLTLGAVEHRAELENPEPDKISPDAILSKENGAAGVDLDPRRNQEEQGRQDRPGSRRLR